nr:MAG TPA: hypothetical protein [Caudoviricetes sp.]
MPDTFLLRLSPLLYSRPHLHGFIITDVLM